jgi:TonB family protein
MKSSHEWVMWAVVLAACGDTRSSPAISPLATSSAVPSASQRRPWTPEDDRRVKDYVSHVEAEHPEAPYLSEMHKRIHAIFSDSFLSSLDSLPKTDPLNDKQLVSNLEIVLTPDGRLLRATVMKTSGVTAFDNAAVDSVERGAPFGPAPPAVVSRDGDVHITWAFHRDGVWSCSQINARLLML